MAQAISPDGAKAWLDGLPGGGLGDELAQRWQRFAEIDVPVVTVFGAYDTGKSSLLRRLIVDSGGEAPEWLTITARHETFDVNECRIAGCAVRDTPGFVVGGTDVRADHNTQLATEAVALTDVAIVTVTPQLATAEYEVLRDIVAEDWLPKSLWFVITRFDEAGVDPESDPDGYQALGERKTAELRRALELSDAVPVFVVCQDFAQMAGSQRNPNPRIWDESREWDGMDAVRAALDALGDADGGALRHAAEQRFWRQSVTSALAELRAGAVDYGDHADFTNEGMKQRESWTAQLDALRRGADVEIRAAVAEIVSNTTDEESLKRLGQSLSACVDTWYSAQHRNVDKLLQGVAATAAIQRDRPSSKRLQSLADAIELETTDAAEQEFTPTVTPVVERIAKKLLTVLADYDKAGQQRRGKRAAAKDAPPTGLGQFVAAGTVLLPVLVDVAKLAETFLRQRSAEAAERERVRSTLRADVQRVGDEAVAVAVEAYVPLLDAARAAIVDATAQQVDMHDGLERLTREIGAHIASGEVLLQG